MLFQSDSFRYGFDHKINFADFLAIYILSPFTLTPVNANAERDIKESFWECNKEMAILYHQWQEDKTATENKQARKYFTDEYIADRSQMLLSKMIADYKNKDYEDAINSHTTYKDNESKVILGNDKAILGRDKCRIIFGKDNEEESDILIGGNEVDKLYGGSGDDVLINCTDENTYDNRIDYLEGGAGYDKYYVGKYDIIFDVDGDGCIFFNGHKLSQFKADDNNDSVWYEIDENGNKTGLKALKEKEIDLKIVDGDNHIIIKQFFEVGKYIADGNYQALDITLLKSGEEEYLLCRGDIRPNTNEKGDYAVDWEDRSQRNKDGEIINGKHQEGFEDVIYGKKDAKNKIYGLGGNDVLHGANNDDVIIGGEG
ncbi:MAG: hypothetical protein IK065_01995 [Neisseriaceae bacterium]|nr:hypothetical protein [Neisseriaceae bacterium]